ncbi:MAG: hypothetical protein ACYTEL_23235 [Planctomycetota bacterium]
MKTTTTLSVFLLAITVSLTGCAVLTVDVDVYKGPLANHKDVQVEQMAAMAIGAKPLLVELRDTLEASDHNDLKVKNAASFRKKGNRQCWYKPAYIGPGPGETKSRFENQNADRVNNILYLYEDRRDDQFSRLIDRAQQAVRDYNDAYAVFRPESLREDQFLWEKLEPEFKDCKEEWKPLADSYKKFCTSGERDARDVFERWNQIYPNLKDSQVNIPDKLQNNPLLKDKDKELEDSSNAAFRVLAETSLVDFQAEHLFKLRGEKKKGFVNHVKNVSREFLRARSALERLWHVEMEAIVWLSDQPVKTAHGHPPMIEIAKASLNIIQPYHVATLMELKPHITQDMPEEIEDLKRLLPELTASKLAESRQWNYEKAKGMLLDAFTREPVKTAKGLLASHKFCKLRLYPKALPENKRPKQRLQYISGWEFGLVRGPFELALEPEQLKQNTDQVFRGGAFAKGRLDDGLETLIEDYLMKANVCRPNDLDLVCARERLSDALVRFAQKVLFVANNNSLLKDPDEDDPGLVPGLAGATVRGLWGGGPEPPKTRHYVRVLQAVGNSVLVQVDALRQEDAHEAKLKGRLESEIRAVNYTLSQPPSRVIDRLLKSLRAKRAAWQKKLKKAEIQKAAADDLVSEAQKVVEATKKEIVPPVPEESDGTFEEAAGEVKKEVIAAHSLLVASDGFEPVLDHARKLVQKAKGTVSGKNNLKDWKLALSAKLDEEAKHADVPRVKRLLSNTAAYLQKLRCPDENITRRDKAYQRIEGLIQEHYPPLLIKLAQKADEANGELEEAKSKLKEAEDAVRKATKPITKLANAIAVIGQVKYEVLRKVDKIDGDVSPKLVHDLLKLTVQEKLKEAENGSESAPEVSKFQRAIAVLDRQSPPMEAIVVDESLLRDKDQATAKDVRDLWITLLEYEHDLALRNGKPERAVEIGQALKAAEEKRAGMVYIRPAMAYLRTSFPSTSLQDNPNLTWDNMLGGHMMRSTPFGPQLRDFFDPGAKCDALINSEIDKQFWQNINRVRVAGGGKTNYVVAKDDIGNWYVKHYSADPEDVIKGAKSLALFSLSAKADADFIARLGRDEDEKVKKRGPDLEDSSLGRVFSDHRADYNRRTKADYDLLYEILKDKEEKIEGPIKEIWEQNKDIKPDNNAGGIDVLALLAAELDRESRSHLEQIKKSTEKKEKETKKQTQKREQEQAERPARIIETLARLRRFDDALTSAIRDNLAARADIEITQRDMSEPKRQKERDRVIRARAAAIPAVTSVVRAELTKIIVRRKDAVEDYERAILFVGDAVR